MLGCHLGDVSKISLLLFVWTYFSNKKQDPIRFDVITGNLRRVKRRAFTMCGASPVSVCGTLVGGSETLAAYPDSAPLRGDLARGTSLGLEPL